MINMPFRLLRRTFSPSDVFSRKHGTTVDPVFGQEKHVRGCDRFMVRGKGGVRSEWKLICSTHNLLKLWRSGKAAFKRLRSGLSGLEGTGNGQLAPCGYG